jgi:ABC-2 type transport system permease protein
VFIGLGWGMLLFGLDLSETNPAALALTILVTTFSTAGLGLLMGCMSLVTRNVMLVNNTVYFLLLIFSGANFPVESIPGWLQPVSQALPLTRGIASARLIIAGGTFTDIANLLGQEAIIGIILVLAGFIMFRLFETKAKQLGTLDIF